MDYIPRTDTGAAQWLTAFATLLLVQFAAAGLTQAEATQIDALATDYATKLAACADPTTRSKVAVMAKNEAKATAMLYVRPRAQKIATSATVTAELKTALGLNPHVSMPSPVPAPSTAPGLNIVSLIPGQATIGHTNPDNGAKAKPTGVIAIEIATVTGTAYTADPSAAVTRGSFTRGKIVFPLAPEASGQKVSLFGRYATRSGPGGLAQVGPWSAPVQFVAP